MSEGPVKTVFDRDVSERLQEIICLTALAGTGAAVSVLHSAQSFKTTLSYECILPFLEVAILAVVERKDYGALPDFLNDVERLPTLNLFAKIRKDQNFHLQTGLMVARKAFEPIAGRPCETEDRVLEQEIICEGMAATSFYAGQMLGGNRLELEYTAEYIRQSVTYAFSQPDPLRCFAALSDAIGTTSSGQGHVPDALSADLYSPACGEGAKLALHAAVTMFEELYAPPKARQTQTPHGKTKIVYVIH